MTGTEMTTTSIKNAKIRRVSTPRNNSGSVIGSKAWDGPPLSRQAPPLPELLYDMIRPPCWSTWEPAARPQGPGAIHKQKFSGDSSLELPTHAGMSRQIQVHTSECAAL